MACDEPVWLTCYPEIVPLKKFTTKVRKVYLDSLRSGNLKYESARMCGVSYRTVERHRADDDDFREDERHATAQAREGVEKILYGMALEGDLGAINKWLTAHDRSTYGDKAIVQIDATQSAVELTQNVALAKVAELQRTLTERRQRLLETGDIIDVPSEEVPQEFNI